jgi:hypothetical protein
MHLAAENKSQELDARLFYRDIKPEIIQHLFQITIGIKNEDENLSDLEL